MEESLEVMSQGTLKITYRIKKHQQQSYIYLYKGGHKMQQLYHRYTARWVAMT